MSEALQISQLELKKWLEKETSSVFIPVHEKAQKLLNKMNHALEDVSEVCKMLFENSKKEIEKRNMKTYGRARALNKLGRLFLERMRQIEIPEKVSYDSFSDFTQKAQKNFVVTEVDIKNWFPRISPFFIMDRRKFSKVYEKAKESLNELKEFLEKEYVKTKTLEETFQLIEKTSVLEGQLADLEARREKNNAEKASIEGRIVDAQQRIANLKSKDSMTQLNQTSTEINKLRKDVRQSLRHLRKPFIKFQSQVFRKGGLKPEELEKLDNYIDNPFDAFAVEEPGYPMLKEILKKLMESISDGKLKLKHDRRRKAEQAITRILMKNSLDALHQRCHEAKSLKKQLSTSVEMAKVKTNLLKLQENVKRLDKRKRRTVLEGNTIEQDLEETQEEIHISKSKIEKNVLDFLDRRIIIE